MTPALLFSVLNLMTLAAWLALVFLPRLLYPVVLVRVTTAFESTCVSAYVQMQRRFGYGTDRGEALRSLVTFACRRSPAARKKIKLTSGLLSS